MAKAWYEMSKDELNLEVRRLDKIRKHKMLTEELKLKFVRQGDTSEREAEDIKVIAKFFNPYGNWTWYACEFDPRTGQMFGYVKGHEDELGYFNFYEVATATVRLGGYELPLERDCGWDSGTILKDVIDGGVS